MTLQARPGIMDVQPYRPGAPAPEGAVKLSSNENALGCSPKASQAFVNAMNKLHIYPDGGATQLRQAIANSEHIDFRQIVCGAGSDEILQLIGRAFLSEGDKVVQSQYGFLVYRLVAMQSGAYVAFAPEKNFTTNIDALIETAGDDTKIVFLANPNNPTGTVVPLRDIKRLREKLPKKTLLVLDGAYDEFVDMQDYKGALDLVDNHDNMVVTRTFSKIHGLAAVRLGWMYAPEYIADIIQRVRGPFNVNLPAIEAGIAAIEDKEFLEKSKNFNKHELRFLLQSLRGFGYEVSPSVCNFVMIHFPSQPGQTARDANKFLTSKGLIVRDLRAYGLPDALRISIGSKDANRQVVDALETFKKQSTH